MVNSAEEKAELFKRVLFPEVSDADMTDTARYKYPLPLPAPPISLPEIRRAILRAAPGKAPGPDGLLNRALQQVLPMIEPHLDYIFNWCLRVGYCPKHFRRSNTVVLRKPGKGDYTNPKNYRPIALLSAIGKALESIIASRISYLVEQYALLPQNHIGGRRGRSCEHALHLLQEQVHAAWRDGYPVATLLTLDVSGAYDNVFH